MKIYRSFLMLLIAVMLSGCSKSAPPGPKEQAAIDSALAWLALVDQQDYARSWEESAALFRNAVAKDGWVNSLKTLHSPMGKMESRNVINAKYETSLPNTPKGEYVVIQFKTQFENKKGAIETVTPMMDPDGKWRVSGYYVK